MDNRIIARRLLDMAHCLEEKQANFYRVKAYRRAAQTVLGLDRPVEEIVAGAGRKALQQLPGIGGSMSEKIETLVRTGDITNVREDNETLLTAR
jgi:DNA polymerase/3'-5' exonuclease PolX